MKIATIATAAAAALATALAAHPRPANAASAWSTALLAPFAPAIAQDVIELPGRDVPLDAGFEEVYRVGSIGGANWEQFGDIGSVGFDAEGNLYIYDGQAFEGIVVDADGQFVRRFGGPGDGPGELRFAFGMAVMRDGRVVIPDMGHNAYILFGRDGEYERTVGSGQESALGGFGLGLAREAVADPSGLALISVIAGGSTMTISGGSGESSGSPARAVQRVALDGEEAATTVVARPWTPPTQMTEEKIELPPGASRQGDVIGAFNIRRQRPPVFEPRLHAGPLPDGSVALADSTTYAIKIVREGEGVIRTLTRPFSPIPVTRRVERAWRERRLEALEAEPEEDEEDRRSVRQLGDFTVMRARPSREQQLKSIEEARFYEEVSVVQGLRTTWNGRIWVRRGAEDGDPNGPWDVLSSDGQYVGTYPPDIVIPQAFGPGGLAAYVEMDEYEVEMVRVVRMPTEVN